MCACVFFYAISCEPLIWAPKSKATGLITLTHIHNSCWNHIEFRGKKHTNVLTCISEFLLFLFSAQAILVHHIVIARSGLVVPTRIMMMNQNDEKDITTTTNAIGKSFPLPPYIEPHSILYTARVFYILEHHSTFNQCLSIVIKCTILGSLEKFLYLFDLSLGGYALR